MTVQHKNASLCSCRLRAVQLVLCLLTLSAPLSTASAQAVADSVLRVGSRVRVATVNPDYAIGAQRAIGIVQSMTSDSISVAWENGLRSTLTPVNISRIDLSVGHKPYVLRGMGLGLLSGVLAGGVIGAVSYEPSEFLDFGIGVEILAHSIIFGAAGTVIGGVVGATGRRENWLPIQVLRESRRVSAQPFFDARAQGVRVTVRF